ncbi:GspH/FimT family pseudopilin [Vibrio hepatarius]|uniref:GspH/FimT family pseudopilin n=1 Tax=Vibrio hepatarius TaxID=171383 RepID=UPI00148D928C|nr:GspH/FimT family pseudopilin [Vibrio hepatarius]NOI12520.1 prepilin-type N-terminal cleavage/methylation domain-containing protein [Vibrio hepatarius]
MPRGFTLLELLITIVVLTAMMAFAVPSFSALSGQTKMTQLASSLQTFLHQAKSEAVFRNQDLWAHIDIPTNPDSTGSWRIVLTDADTPGVGTTFKVFSGSPFINISVAPNYVSDQIKFDGVRGKITGGSISFYPADDSSEELVLKSSYGASRILVCGEGGSRYGYPAC